MGEIVLPPAAGRERHARLAHRKKRRVVEATRKHVPEELLRVMAAAFADDFAQGRDVAVRERHFYARIERLEICAHRAAARSTHHAELRGVEVWARLHVVYGAHCVPDAETGKVPSYKPRPRPKTAMLG